MARTPRPETRKPVTAAADDLAGATPIDPPTPAVQPTPPRSPGRAGRTALVKRDRTGVAQFVQVNVRLPVHDGEVIAAAIEHLGWNRVDVIQYALENTFGNLVPAGQQ